MAMTKVVERHTCRWCRKRRNCALALSALDLASTLWLCTECLFRRDAHLYVHVVHIEQEESDGHA